MAGALAAEHAGVEGKSVHLEGWGGEQAVFLEIFADPGRRRFFQAGQGDVRREFPVFQFQAELKQAGGDLALEGHQRFAPVDPSPDHPGLAAGREEANPLQTQGKGRDLDFRQGLTDIKEGGAVDLADEAEGEMKLFRRGPAGIGQAATEPGQLLPDFRGRIDGDKKPFVHDLLPALSGRVRSAHRFFFWCAERTLQLVVLPSRPERSRFSAQSTEISPMRSK